MIKKEQWDEQKTLVTEAISAFLVFSFIIFLIFYAVCQTRYVVTFDSLGGNQITSQKILEGKLVKVPTNPVRAGYVFLGWYVGDTAYDFQAPVTSDITLEAKWEKVDPTKIRGVNLNDTEVVFSPNSQYQLTARIYPGTADQTITWTSSNPSVVTVDETGKIVAYKAGTATVTATAIDKEHTGTCTVTVVNGNIEVQSIAFTSETLELKIGETAAAPLKFNPVGSTNQTATWTSSDISVATVDQSGNITAVNKGTTTITAISTDGGYKAQLTLTVKKN